MIFVLVLVPTWVIAATLFELAGTWEVQVSEKFIVKKLGKDTGESTGTIWIWALDELNGIFNHDNYQNDYVYTGYSYLPGGKKLYLSLDAGGKTQLENMLENWIEDWVASEGGEVTDVFFEFDKESYCAAKISKRTNAPNRVKMTIKGKVSGWVTDDVGIDYVTTKFTYKATITFIRKIL